MNTTNLRALRGFAISSWRVLEPYVSGDVARPNDWRSNSEAYQSVGERRGATRSTMGPFRATRSTEERLAALTRSLIVYLCRVTQS